MTEEKNCPDCGKFMSNAFVEIPKDRYTLAAGKHIIGKYCPDCGIFI